MICRHHTGARRTRGRALLERHPFLPPAGILIGLARPKAYGRAVRLVQADVGERQRDDFATAARTGESHQATPCPAWPPLPRPRPSRELHRGKQGAISSSKSDQIVVDES